MKDDAPLVTVIIPTHNSASTLEQCLQSVRAQTYPNIEVLVVDNHSLDDTIEIAAPFAKVIQAGPERSAQINVGARKAHGVYLYRIDGDMLLEPGVVQACVEAIQKDGYDAIAVPNRSQGEGFWARVRTLERDTYLDDPLIVAARFWKRVAFEAVGGMDETLVSCEDYDLHNRLVAAGYRIGRISATEFHLGESESLWDYATQGFYYGPSVFRYLRKHPRRGVRQMIPLRSSYLRHWNTLARQPSLTFGLVLLKLVQYVAAALGIAADGLGLVTERGRVAYQAVAGFLLVLFSIWALVSSIPDIGIQPGKAGSWAILAAGLLGWQGVSRLRARNQAESLSATLLGVSLAFSPLLLLPVMRPMLGETQSLETWRMASTLATAVSLSWVFYLSRPSPKSANYKELSKARSGHLALVILLVAIVAFTAVFTLSGLKLLGNFSLRSYDLAAIDQALWGTARSNSGGSLSNLLYSSIYERSLFAFDVAPAILLLLPFYLVGLGGAEFLLFSQALGLGIGAFALFRLGKNRIGHLPAMLVALGYLAFFLTVRLAQGRFIMLTWSIPLILLAVDAFQRRRILLFYLFSSLALACGIDAAWALAALGLYLIVVQRDRTHGFITLVLGVSWLAMAATAFAPLFGGTATEALGWSELSVEGTTFSANLGKLLHPESLSYLWTLLMPTAFLPILGIPLLLPAAPRLLFNLLAENPSAISLNGRYEIIVLPFLFAGIIAGIDWLASRARKRNWAPPQFATGTLVLVTCLCSLLLLEPGFATNLSHRTTMQEAAMLEAGHRIIEEISPQASVAVQSPFATTLAHRQLLTILPRAEDAQYILFDVFHPNREPVPLAYQESLMRAFQNPLYGLRSFDYGYLLFERDLDPATKKAALVSDTLPDIQYARRVELGDTIAYLGFDLPTTIVQAGENVYITHYWESILPTPNPYLQFTAYPGSQRFEKIALGVYSPEQWNPGDVVLHRQLISFPDLPDGKDYEIVVGLWYDSSEPVLQNPEQLLGQDVIRIATLSVSGNVYEIHPWFAQVHEDTP